MKNIIIALLFALSVCAFLNPSLGKSLIMLESGWQFRQAGTEEWLNAQVPGNVHMDLLENGKIDDPFFRMNEQDLQWIGNEAWEYKTVFKADADLTNMENIDLLFDGIDTYAEVFINDKPVLQADNMFRRWRIGVGKLIREGENDLLVRFRSPIAEAMPRYDSIGYMIPVSANDQSDIKVSVYSRKAGYHYGWDWGPRFVTCGLWRPVYIEAWNDARIDDLYVEQKQVDDSKARLAAILEIPSEVRQHVEIVVHVDGGSTAVLGTGLLPGMNKFEIPFEIDAPELWWPNGMGSQRLYHIKTTLKRDNITLDESVRRIGIRTIEVVREPDSDGHSFYFSVNGKRVFMKGANYIPQDNFLNRVTREKYRELLQSAADAHMNMIRVWGGGIYENDIFYDLCDEKGLLVWQDFMFACAMLPFEKKFLENIYYEAVDNVVRLRNHPSIALWCGNNESLSAWYQWGWKAKYDRENPKASKEIWVGYQKIFYEILPKVVARFDANRYYWPSSPSSSYTEPANPTDGDLHYWSVWHGRQPYEAYEENAGRFVSEFGFQAFPPFETVKTYTLPEDYGIESEVMLSHQRHPVGNQLIRDYMQRDYKEPKDFESFLYASNLLQADVIRYAIEGYRRRMPYTMGALYWQLNDCWPVASWSGIDYYGRWKALHYSVKEAFAPVITAPKVTEDSVQFYIVSDRQEKVVNAEFKLVVYDLAGKVLRQTLDRIDIPANESRILRTDPIDELIGGMSREEVFILTSIRDNDQILSKKVTYLVKPRELFFEKAEIKHHVRPTENGFEVVLSTDTFAPKVFLSVDNGTNFTDNYLDLIRGAPRSVFYKTDMSLKEFKQRLRIRTLQNSF